MAAPRTLTLYLWGQVGNAAKMAVWWTAVSPLILQLTDRETAIGTGRLAYNLAMLVLCPIAGVFAEKLSVRAILNFTTTFRFIIWSGIVPLGWVLFKSGLVSATESLVASYALIIVVMFIDGTQVAFGTVVDVDSGGTDLLANEHGLEVDDEIRNQFNTIHQGFFDGSLIVFSPAIAGISYLITRKLGDDDNVWKSGGLVVGVGCAFLFASVWSLVLYNTSVPKKQNQLSIQEEDPGTKDRAAEVKAIFKAIGEGFAICWRNAAVRWRVFFFALETALEDAFIAVVVIEYTLRSPSFANGDSVLAAVWTSLIVAVGKIGAVAAAVLMNKYWVPPENIRGYRVLFVCVFLGGLSTVLLPVSLFVDTTTAQRVLVFLSALLFFVFSTFAKIGFATLMQSLASEADASGRIFGIIGTAVVSTDAVIILALTVTYEALAKHDHTLKLSMYVSCGVYLVHGLVELVFGPSLVLVASGRRQSHVASLPGGDLGEALLGDDALGMDDGTPDASGAIETRRRSSSGFRGSSFGLAGSFGSYKSYGRSLGKSPDSGRGVKRHIDVVNPSFNC